ncbi:meiosis-specific protein MEI4 [Pleurodeles waltl]|uniref:meiosis-specific protein MEI4 n=1 Tax=Pleurodeles waltl TaxID=8319 RepID=UPI003709A531
MEEAAESSGISDVKDQSEVPTWFNLTTKVALALAIIRTTPIGRSAKAYTEYLAKRVSGHEFNWKSKVEELEAEVLWLRQQLFLNKIQSANASERVEKGDISTGASSHEENTHTAKHLHQLEDDSGCDTCNEERMNLVGNSQSFDNSLRSLTDTFFLDWPYNPMGVKENNCLGVAKKLTAHTRFLRDLLGLRKLTESGNVTANFTKFESNSSVLSDSVSGLLDGLLYLYKNPNDHFSALQTESINVLTNLISDTRWSNFVIKKCVNKFGEFEKELISYILCNSGINRFQAQHSIADCLVMLGRCNLMRKPLLCLLLREVSQFVDNLQCEIWSKGSGFGDNAYPAQGRKRAAPIAPKYISNASNQFFHGIGGLPGVSQKNGGGFTECILKAVQVQKTDCKQVLHQSAELFSLTPGQITRCTHDVDTGNNLPVKIKICRRSDHVKELIKAEEHLIHIGKVLEALRKAGFTIKTEASYDFIHYENMCSIYWVLEQLFQHRAEEKELSDDESYQEEIRTFLKTLDKATVCLSDEFPLIALYTWRLGVLFNSSRNMETSNE